MSEKMDNPSDGQLVERARNGCLDSFGVLYRRFYGGMVALAYSSTQDISAAEDAAQETFAIACRTLPKLKNKENFAAWLAGICRNVAKQINRQEFHKNVHRLPCLQTQSEQNLFTDEVRQIVWQLHRRDREPIVLRYYDNLSYQQIAGVLNISEEAVHGRLIRAKRKIAKQLKSVGVTEANYEDI
jgi:RNA polymerase sigma-70 factor (ECF subfamily)